MKYFFYKHTKVSFRQRRQQTQFKFMVKKLFVVLYSLVSVVSVFGTKTRKVQQHPSHFSTLNTLLVSPSAVLLLVGIDQAVPLPAQVYNIIGLVLHTIQFGPPPNAGLSQD